MGVNYLKPHYLTLERWMSYYYQINLVTKYLESYVQMNLLEIGPGNRVVWDILSRMLPVNLYSLDIKNEATPSVNSSLVLTPFRDDSFDLVTCFQVLEHIPFGEVGTALGEFSRISKSKIIISIPHGSIHLTIAWKVSSRPISFVQFARDTKYLKYKRNEEHFWEIGAKDRSGIYISFNDLLEKFRYAGLEIIEEFRNPYFPWHHFIVLKK